MFSRFFDRLHRENIASADPQKLLNEAREQEVEVARVVDDMAEFKKRNNFGPNWAAALKEAPR
jgi:hypothetical protein